MKLSKGFTELTTEEQQIVTGGGLLTGVCAGLFNCISSVLGSGCSVISYALRGLASTVFNCLGLFRGGCE